MHQVTYKMVKKLTYKDLKHLAKRYRMNIVILALTLWNLGGNTVVKL